MDEKDEVNQTGDHASIEGKRKKGNWFLKFIVKNLSKKAINILVIVAILFFVVGGIGIGINTFFAVKSKTTKLALEDVGELATQAAYCTNVNVMDKSRTLFGTSIPFTQSKYIYSYDTVIKAGIDFADVEVKSNEITKVLTVEMPEVKVLSCEVDFDSIEVYLEDESIFTQIDLKDQNDSMIELTEKAQQDAIGNGLLDDAKENAKTLLLGFLGKSYDLTEYTVDFAN